MNDLEQFTLFNGLRYGPSGIEDGSSTLFQQSTHQTYKYYRREEPSSFFTFTGSFRRKPKW